MGGRWEGGGREVGGRWEACVPACVCIKNGVKNGEKLLNL